MPALSIVIPALGDTASLETTLVSVLSHQPDDCEILVVLAAPYDDPYDLAGEIRFVPAEPGAGWADCVNIGIHASRSHLVHLLYPGVEVSEGWAEPALDRFARDPRLGAVSPLVLDAERRQQVLTAGVAYRSGGARRLVRGSLGRIQHPGATRRVLGPSRLGGFYRKSALCEFTGLFESSLGETAADVDLAIRLQHAGVRVAVETGSQLVAHPSLVSPAQGEWARSRAAERLFWRNAAVYGWGPSLAAHVLHLAGTLLGGLFVPWRLPARSVGRLLGVLSLPSARRHHQVLAEMRQSAAAPLDEEPTHLRLDQHHAQPKGPTRYTAGDVPLRRSA